MKNGNDIRDVSQGTLLVGETSVVVLSTDAKTVLGNERLASIKLSQVENERAKKFVRQCDRENFAAVRILARCAAAMEIGCHPDNVAIVQQCKNCGGAHGQPYLPQFPELHISWSHTETGIAVAIGRAPVGVDIESWSSGERSRDIAAEALAPDEHAFIQAIEANHPFSPDKDRCLSASNSAILRLWTCKESLVKLGLLSLELFSEYSLIDMLDYRERNDYFTKLKNVAGKFFLTWNDFENKYVGAAVSIHKPTLYSIDSSQVYHLATSLDL